MQMIWQDCERCGKPFAQPYDPGRRRQFCSNACRQSAYRARVRYAKQARERREREEQARRCQEQARRAEEEARRRSRQRSRRQPPPHAGSSRPGSWCGACGGMRAQHTFHHDDAAHERAQRRYEALRRKAASTTFPEEATACNAKAGQLRDKYGL